MTPTLFGRWQTRLFLLATVGVILTLPFFFGLVGPLPRSGIKPIFFWILLYVALFGLIWDLFYIYLQRFRWDRDWPGILQLMAGIWEALFLVAVIQVVGLPGVTTNFVWSWFLIHYSVVWLGFYLTSQTLMRILFPYWRFNGGRLF